MRVGRRSTVIVLALVLLLASAGITAAVIIPSAEDLLVRSLTSLEETTDGHALVSARATLPEQELSLTVEVWGRLDAGPDGEPAARMEVLASSKPELEGLILVSDGAQFWLYDPGQNRVTTGRAEEMAPLLAERLSDYAGQWGDMDHDFDEAEIPQTAEEAVARLLDYFSVERAGLETMAGLSAHRLRLIPIPEKMPDEVRAAGGYLYLWLRTGDAIPLGLEYAKGAPGHFKVEASMLEVNQGVADSTFTFDIPAGAEVIDAAQKLAEYRAQAEPPMEEFEALEPSSLPEGAEASTTRHVGGAVIQRFRWPDGRSFFVAQGSTIPADLPGDSARSESVTIRGVEGTLFLNEDGTRALLSWQEGDFSFLIGGDVSSEQALALAESLQ
jgi:outer membrane lipoprotein-sorting protein